jgi:hypothetical protein
LKTDRFGAVCGSFCQKTAPGAFLPPGRQCVLFFKKFPPARAAKKAEKSKMQNTILDKSRAKLKGGQCSGVMMGGYLLFIIRTNP